MMPLLRHVSETGSTNDDMRARILAGAPHGEGLWADVQSAGRGRLGRVWQSPPGTNLALSVAVVLPRLATVASQIPLMVGVVAAQTIAAQCGVQPRLKWPNDLLVGDKKLGGILCEAVQRPGQPQLDAVVVGLGVNVLLTPQDPAWQTLPDEVAARLVSLRMLTAQVPAREVLAGALRHAIDTGARRLVDEGPAPWLAAWRTLDCTRGRRVALPAGAHPVATRAKAIDLDDDGALLVQPCDATDRPLPGGTLRLHAGEITFLPDNG